MRFRTEESVHSDILRNERIFPCPMCCRKALDFRAVPTFRCHVCGECGTKQKICSNCSFGICWDCYGKILNEPERRQFSTLRKPDIRNENPGSDFGNFADFGLYLCIAIVVGMFGLIFLKLITSESRETPSLLESLKENYPSQKNETWFNILSVLQVEDLTVKSLILLHGEDKKTCECLTRKLVSVYSKNRTSEKDGIVFGSSLHKGKDYGEVLEYYRSIVRKHRVFVTDLNSVPPSTARIFHSLCDEVSSDIKPSLFIFTLRYDDKTENLKPIPRATSVLKKAWKELPGSDVFPLLSRVVRNVVEIVPEKEISC